MRQKLSLEVLSADHHRNGVGGVGFYAVLFNDRVLPKQSPFIASIFDGPEQGYCAVYSVPELTKGNIQFACGNSWRGDMYEHELRAMLSLDKEPA